MKKSLLSMVVLAAVASTAAHAGSASANFVSGEITSGVDFKKVREDWNKLSAEDQQSISDYLGAARVADFGGVKADTVPYVNYNQKEVTEEIAGKLLTIDQHRRTDSQADALKKSQMLNSYGHKANSEGVPVTMVSGQKNNSAGEPVSETVQAMQKELFQHNSAIAANTADLKTTATKLDKVEQGVAGNYNDLKATGEKLDKVEQVVAGNYTDLKATGEKLSKVETVVAGNYTDLKETGEKLNKVETVVAGNYSDIKDNIQQINKVQAVVVGQAAQEAIRNGDKYQGMLNARQAAMVKAAVDSVPVTKPVDHSKEIAANKAGIERNHADVSKLATQQKIDSVHYGQQIQTLAGNQGVLADAVNTNATVINNNAAASRAVQSQVERNTQSISKLNSNFSSLKNQVESDRSEYRGGIATATALAGLPQVNANQKFMVSAAAGTFKDASAIAVGGSANITEHVVVKFGVSDSTEGDAAANVGIGYGF